MGLAQMHRAPTHPGEVFEEDFRKPAGLSQAEAARMMEMSANRLNEIVKGKRGVTADTAIAFETLTGSSAEFWLTLQIRFDLWHATQKMKPTRRVDARARFPIAGR